MSLFHKIIVGMAIGSFLGLILLGVLGHVLQVHVPARNHGTLSLIFKGAAILLLGMLVFSIFPLALHLFIVLQGRTGNADVGMVRFLREHERGVTFALWGVFLAGLLIALPTMLADAKKASAPPSTTDETNKTTPSS